MQVFKYTWLFFEKRKKQFFYWFCLSSLASSGAILPPIFIGKLVDQALPTKQMNLIFYFSLFIVLSFVVSLSFQAYSKYLLEKLMLKVTRKIKRETFSKYQTKDLFSLMAIGNDSLYQRITRSIQVIKNNLTLIMKDIIGLGVSTVLCFIIIGKIDILIPFLFLIVYIPYIFIRRHLFKKKTHLYFDSLESNGKLIQLVREVIQGIRLIKLHNTEILELNKLESEQHNSIKIQIKLINFYSQLILLNIIMNLVPEVIVYIYLGYKVFNGENTIGNMIVIIGLLSQIRGFMWQLSKYSFTVEEYKVYLKEIQEVEGISNEPFKGTWIQDSIRGEIWFNNISFKYQQQIVLDSFNLKIKQGQSIGIVGLSGAGKSTLANILVGLSNPEKGGFIEIDGVQLNKWNLNFLRKHICYITQKPYLLNNTIRANLCYGLNDISETQLWEVLEKVSLFNFVNELPDKLDTSIGEHGIQLSGGQKQRIVIARAFLNEPSIIILDEATSALDLESEHTVQISLEKLMKDKTSIIIAHRLSTLNAVDIIVVIDNGKIVEEGTHQDLLEKKAFFYELYRSQYNVIQKEKV